MLYEIAFFCCLLLLRPRRIYSQQRLSITLIFKLPTFRLLYEMADITLQLRKNYEQVVELHIREKNWYTKIIFSTYNWHMVTNRMFSNNFVKVGNINEERFLNFCGLSIENKNISNHPHVFCSFYRDAPLNQNMLSMRLPSNAIFLKLKKTKTPQILT